MVNLEINNSYNGFRLSKKEFIKETNCNAHVFIHEKSGARLLYMQNDEENCVFETAFRTPPKDSSGASHILEHSVLCGSRKFPMKDPFAEILRSSIQTFLNALTYPDKTVYPVATNNKQEFTKLMDVYLDAVFYPKLLEDKNIFLQEGWRFELDDMNEPLKISGVVYGEMKGVFSSPINLIGREISKHLLRDTAYGVESGGDPKEIPKLSYEALIEHHQKYYHPSNSYMFLYGNMDIKEKLEFLDKEYLSRFDKIGVNESAIRIQNPVEIKEEKIKYPIEKGEDKKDKYFFNKSWIIGDSSDTKLILSFEILELILFDMPSSPLKNRLFEAGIAKNVECTFEREFRQPFFSVIVQNTNIEDKEKFESILDETFDSLSKSIDDDLITAAINKKEFEVRENISDFGNEGISYFESALTTWLHDEKQVFDALRYEKKFEEIRDAAKTDYFEDLIKKYFIENNHKMLLVLEPDENADTSKEEREFLEKTKEKLSGDELKQIVNQTKEFRKFQEEEDSKEDIEKIKIIDPKKDINKNPKRLELEKSVIEDIEILSLDEKTRGIDYLNFYFDAKVIAKEKIPYLSLLTEILEEVKTKNFSLDDFSNEINTYIGHIEFDLIPYEKGGKLGPRFMVAAKLLDRNLDRSIELLNELFNRVIFDEKKVKEILERIKSNMNISILESGHVFSINRLCSHFTAQGHYNEMIEGVRFYRFVCELVDNFEDIKDKIMSDLWDVYNSIFSSKNLVIGYMSENVSLDFVDKIELEKKSNDIIDYEFNLNDASDAILTQSQVNYVSKGFNFKNLGYDYNGGLEVLKTLLRFDYLWNEVRLKGGAYGAFALIRRNGDFAMGSFRDPNIKDTIKAYDNFSKYLQNLDLSKRDIDKYIISTISDIDNSALTVEDKFNKALNHHFLEIGYDELAKTRKEILSVTKDDLKEYSNMINKIMKKDVKTIIGNSDQIKKSKLFDNHIKV